MSRKSLLAVVCLAFALFAFVGGGLGYAQSPKPTCDVGVLPSSIVAGEFNKDAIPDLAVANHSSNSVTILFSGGTDCTIQFPKVGATLQFGILSIPVEEGPTSLAVGDFEGDGCQDLAVAQEMSHNIAVILSPLNTCKPRDVRYIDIHDSTIDREAEGSIFVAVGDFDRDGHQDIVVVDQISDDIYILQGDNKGNFPDIERFPRDPKKVVGNRPNSVSVSDLDGDGIQDLVVSNELDDSIRVLKGTGKPGSKFEFCGEPIKVGLGPSYVIQSFGWGWLGLIFPQLLSPIVPDFNRDGLPDLVVVNKGSHDISILLGHGDGKDCTFQKQVRLKTHGSSPTAVILSDFDRDGDQDIAVTNSSTDDVSVFWGDGRGGFTLNRKYPVGPDPSSIAVADFNRDGCWDLAVANKKSAFPQENSTVTILLGEKTPNPPYKQKVPLCTGTFDPPNSPPTANGGQDQETHASRPITLKGSGIDPDDDPISFSWAFESKPEGSQASIENPNSATLSFIPDLVGTYVLRLTVRDSKGASASDTVTVTATNNAPVVNAGEDQTVAVEQTVQLNGRASDPDGDTLSFQWEFSTMPGLSQAAFSRPDMANPTFVPDIEGDYILKLIVRDGLGGSAEAIVRFTAVKSAVMNGKGPSSIAIGDLNKDKTLDLVVVNQVSDNITILLSKGDGSFHEPWRIAAGKAPTSVALGDFNGDDKLDLAVVNSGSDDVYLFWGDGQGGFEIKGQLEVGSVPQDIVAEDFNDDGRLDLAVANADSNNVTLLLGKGNGSFHDGIRFRTGLGPSVLRAKDLSRDGKPDIVVSNFLSFNLSVLLAGADSAFEPGAELELLSPPRSVAIADFNDDDIYDLAVANFKHGVSVLLGKGDAAFEDPVDFRADLFPQAIAAGDLDRDGKPDLAVANFGSGNVSVLLGKGDGTFKEQQKFKVGDGPMAIAIADLNGDKILDIVTANFMTNDVSVLLGKGDGAFQEAIFQRV